MRRVSFKRLELCTFLDHLSLPPVFGGVFIVHSFICIDVMCSRDCRYRRISTFVWPIVFLSLPHSIRGMLSPKDKRKRSDQYIKNGD